MAGKLKSIEEHIVSFRKIFGNKYDYSKAIYTNINKPIIVICPIHGEFEIKVRRHNEGVGCLKCTKEKRASYKLQTQEEVLLKFREVHGDKYDYLLVNYTKGTEKVSIICKSCNNIFLMTPDAHKKNQGCPKCAIIRRANIQLKSLEKLKEEIIKIHGNKFILDYINYKGTETKIKLLCKCCNNFIYTTPHSLLAGCGCKYCATKYNIFRLDEWVKKSKGRPCYFYIIKCWDENTKEEFYKSGITFQKINYRFTKTSLNNYKYEIIYIRKSDAKYIYELEKIFLKFNRENHYIPKRKFGGSTFECFK